MKLNTLLMIVVLFVATLNSVADTKTLYPTQDAAVGTYYAMRTFGNDDFIGIGGSNGMFISLLQFDLSTVKGTVTSAELTLTPDSRTQEAINYNATTGGIVRANYFSWRENGTWIDDIGYYTDLDEIFSRPTRMSAIRIDVTDFVTAWVKGDIPNYGFILEPRSTNNNWTYFRSREYGGSTRPKLVVNFTPPPTQSSSTLSLKLPLPGGKSWYVYTQPGGMAMDGVNDSFHTGINYYSVDFSPKTSVNSSLSFVPIYAAGSGIVTECKYTSGNGNYVVIDHDGDNNVRTGVQTRYLHLKYDPTILGPIGPGLYKGLRVNRGTYLGEMGNTGMSHGTHLHFGVRYQDNGSESISTLKNLKVDGVLLKDFKIGKYYQSTNTR